MKLEGQLTAKHPEWEMNDRDLFGRTDFHCGTVCIDGKTHELLDKCFPTVDPSGTAKVLSGIALFCQNPEKIKKGLLKNGQSCYNAIDRTVRKGKSHGEQLSEFAG